MKTIQKVITGILISLVLGAVGFFVAYLIMQWISNGVFAQWQPLGTPPEGTERFVGYKLGPSRSDDNLYVETLEGKIFHCCTSEQIWQERTLPEYIAPASACDAPGIMKKNIFSKLRYPVKNCMIVTWSVEWEPDRDIVVILTDGTAWKWRDYTSLKLGFSITCGLPILAIIIGWGMVWVSRCKGKKSNDER